MPVFAVSRLWSASYEPIPAIPGYTASGTGFKISDDGQVVIGLVSQRIGGVRQIEGWRWVRGQSVSKFGVGSTASMLSSNGNVVLGRQGGIDFLWSSAGLTNYPSTGEFSTEARYGLSGDGSVVVGSRADSKGNTRGAVWNGTAFSRLLSSEGLWSFLEFYPGDKEIGDPPSYDRYSRVAARAVSGDGNTIVGLAVAREVNFKSEGEWDSYNESGGAIWRGTEKPKRLPWLPGWNYRDFFVNHDGTMIMGTLDVGMNSGSFRFTEEQGFKRIPSLEITAIAPDARLWAARDSRENGGLPGVQEIPGGGTFPSLYRSVLVNSLGGRRSIEELAIEDGLQFEPGSGSIGSVNDMANAGSEVLLLCSFPNSSGVLALSDPLPPIPPASVDSGPILKSAGKFKPKLSFSTVYSETAAENQDGALIKAGRGVWSMAMRGSLEGIDPAAIDSNTEVSFTLGPTFAFTRKLGDDPNWKLGKRSARWTVTEEVNGKAKNILVVQVSWNAATVSLAARSLDAVAYPLIHDIHLGWVGPVEQTVQATARFGALTGETSSIKARGTGTRKVQQSKTAASAVCLDGVKLKAKL